MRFNTPSGRRSPIFCRRALGALAVAMLVAAVLLPSAAFAEGGTVLYSYEKIELPGGDQWGLVPVPARKKLSGKLSKSKLFDAFNELKSDKGATYGHSSIQITGRLPDRAKIVVKIDKSKALKGFAPIIMAETVYTLTELGAQEVEFPGYFKGGMTRADVPFYAYTLSLPLWRALPPGELTHGQVRLPSGELISAQAFYKRWKKKDPALRKALFSYLDDPQNFTVLHVLSLLPKLGVDYTAEVIPLLKHDSSTVRKRALSVLEDQRNDEQVLKAVLAMMHNDKDDKLARAAADFLGQAKADEYNIQKTLFLLDRGSKEEAVEAAKALGKRSKDERANKALYAHLSDKRAEVAQASADALEALDDDARQMKALEDKKIAEDLRLSIARTLAADKSDESKLVGLTYVAEHTIARSAELAIRKLAKLDGDKARETVEGFLSADTRRKRLSAADALVERGAIASLPALAKAIERGENVNELEDYAYQLLVAQPLSTILDKSDSNSGVVKRLAYRALGERAVKEGGSSKVFDKLVKGANSSDAAIRGASARALGAFANDKALDVLQKLTDDKSDDVRAGVAYGLSHFKGGQMFDTLAKYLEDSSPQVVAAALDAMAARREATKWDKIKDLTDAKAPEVRSSALHALATLVSRQDKQGVRKVISLLSGAVSDDNRGVQLTAIRQLATFNDAKATTGIAIQLNAADPNLRVAAIEALGKTGHPSATELVTSVLDDPNPDIRRAAIEALGDLEDKSAEPKLKARLDKEEDAELKKLIKRTLREI